MSDSLTSYKSLDDWFRIVTECRQSGLTDDQWCQINGINKNTFYSAIKRLRQKAYEVPSPMRCPHDDIHDLTCSKQDVVRVDIVSDIEPPEEYIPKVVPHIDNSHMIEIEIGGARVSLCNGADPDLVSKTLSVLRSLS